MADYQLNVTLNGVEQAVSSVGDMEKALEQTNKELLKLDKNSKGFSNLSKQSKSIEKEFKTTSKGAENLGKNIDKVTSSVKNLSGTITAGAMIAGEFDNASQSASDLTVDINNAAKASESLSAQLGAITDELQKLEPGSAKFKELALQAAEMKTKIEDTEQTINSLSGTTTQRFGKALGSSVQIGIAGFQSITAGAALFGVESEALNETLVKLTALLNLSQAIDTFGEFGTKLKDIKAGFAGLTLATNVQTVAQGAETSATVAGTVATTALGTAMKALPIIAIAAAVATLVAGIYSYVNSSKEASIEEEERIKRAEELNAAADEQRKKVAEESGEFLLLISRLKQTNADSEERRVLIDKINTQYGTTLKNLEDEGAFLTQLNLEVQDYVKFQTTRFKLNKNQEEFNKLLEEQERLTTDLGVAQAIYNSELEISNSAVFQDRVNPNLQRSLDSFNEAILALEENKKALDNLGLSTTDLLDKQNELTNSGEKYVDQSEKITKAVEDQKAAEEALKKAQEDRLLSEKELLDSANRLAEQARQLDIEKAKRTTTLIDDLELEKAITIRIANEVYQSQLDNVNREIADKRLRSSTIKQLEEDLKLYLEAIDVDYRTRITQTAQFELDIQNNLINDLILGRQLLTREITVGDQNITDTLEGLAIRREQISINELKAQLDNANLSADSRLLLEQQLSEKIFALEKRRQAEELSQNDIAQKQKIANQEKYYETTYGIAVKYNDLTGQYELDENAKVNEELLKNDTDLNKKKFEAATLAVENLNTERLNIEEEYLVKEAELRDAYREEERIKREEDKQIEIDAITEKFQTGLALAQEFTNALTSLNDLINQTQDQAQVARNEAFIAGEQAKADAVEANYQRDIENNNYTEDQKKAKREQATKQITAIQESANIAVDKSNRELAKKQFNRQKALNITQAVINTAQGVLQAIAQFGPPPSPLGIAGISAAAIIGGIQIAKISSQKFDGGSSGGPTTVSAPSISDTSSSSSSSTPTTNPVTQASSGGFTGFGPDVFNSGGAGATGTDIITGEPSNGRVYVLESDISNVQRRVQTLESNATFG